MLHKLHSIKNKLFLFLELQLLISLVMLPILIAWGLPISYMSIVGNFIFSPFLTIFIFASAIFFIANCFNLPNAWTVFCLNKITVTWEYILSFGGAHWFIGFPQIILPISSLFVVIIIAIYSLKLFNQKQRLVLLMSCCCFTMIIRTVLQPKNIEIVVKQGHQKFYVIKKNNKIFAFDMGALGARPSFQSWIEFTLMPAMVKSMGATHIDTLILCKSNIRTGQAKEALLQCLPTTNIIYPTATLP